MSQPPHATFLNRQYHGLHIPSLLVNQFKSRARELNVRINSIDVKQHAYPPAYIAALQHNHTRISNLINDAILSLSRYGFHLRDADLPIITIVLQDLLHTQSFVHLLSLPPTHILSPYRTPIFPSLNIVIPIPRTLADKNYTTG